MMLRKYTRNKLVIIVGGIAMIVLGIAIFLNPIAAVENLIRIIGWVFVGAGVLTIVSRVMSGRLSADVPMIVVGASGIVLGAALAGWPGFFNKAVWTILGVVILITGVLDVVEASESRSTGSPLAIPATVSGVITMLLGIICIVSPMLIPELGMLVAAISLLIDGVTEVIFGLGM